MADSNPQIMTSNNNNPPVKTPIKTLAENRHSKKKVLVAGGGISGLSAAFELSEDPNIDITIVESSATCGGKMIGYFNSDEQRFEEHSIRALSSTYFSLFNIFDRAGLLHMLTAVEDYQFYQSGHGNVEDSDNHNDNSGQKDEQKGKRVAIDRRAAIDLQTIEAMIETFDLNKKNMLQLVQRIVHHVNASDEERAAMAFKTAGEVIGIDDFDAHTKQFITNWFGILTGARMHSKAVDIMDSFVLMFLPMTEAPVLPEGETSKSYCFNRPTSEVIEALVEKLKARGVTIVTQARVLNMHHHDDGQISVDIGGDNGTTDGLPQQHYDAAVMALPHEVLWKMGLLPQVKKPFNDEWSFGSQFPLAEIPAVFEPFLGKSYNLCFDAPWNIVFQIQHRGGFWQDVEFPDSFDYNLSATCSSPFNRGSLFGKRFMECTPAEAKEEILYQLGITDAEQRQAIAQGGVIDPVNLLYTDNWQPYTDIETAEMGILQDNGKRWVDLAQIYVRNADDELIETTTQWNNVVVAGEIVSVTGRWKIPTMEQAATSGKQAAQALFTVMEREQTVSIETSTLMHQARYKYLDPIVSALSAVTKRL
ncbi:FAD-dependent oxidoreductase [Psychrobacter sp. AOP22-C1-22]|uniref:FAD-dependent oxidoreductase n=1 Tax=unclassified Psychrobacter TaxID=196806 RepID=UPI001788648B|nr:FAD-dependent oxidoreductase [Psychrobacter sp. FME6]MBE0406187.1 FAD-dependent oxidoreductase [Psychrobacter sp. FME6]